MNNKRHNIFHQTEPSSDEELTGVDYMNMPITQISTHPDFSPHAYRVMMAITQMTSAQLENINLGGNE